MGDKSPRSVYIDEANRYLRAARIQEADLEELAQDRVKILEEPAWQSWEGLDPIYTDRHKGMSWYETEMGVKGLAYIIYQSAKDEARDDHAAWLEKSKQEALTQSRDDEADEAPSDKQPSDAAPQSQVNDHDVDPVTGRNIYDPPLSSDDEEYHQDSWNPRDGRLRVAQVSSQGDEAEESTNDMIRGLTLQEASSSPSKSSEPISSIKESSIDNRGVSKSWNLIIDDWEKNKGRKIIYYLSQLHPEVRMALIRGDLPLKMRDPAFKSRHEGSLRARDCQGTYAVYLSVDVPPPHKSMTASHNVGKGLTMRQLEEAYYDVKLYIDVKDPRSARFAKQIDHVCSGQRGLLANLDWKQGQRRYGGGKQAHDDFRHQEEWCYWVEQNVLPWNHHQRANQTDHLLDLALSRCFPYVGLAQNVERRLPDHWNHSSHISPMFGLICAIINKRYPEQFTVQTSYQIFRTVNVADIGLDEKLTTLLCSAYPWDGGLSTAYAGIARGRPDLYNDRDHKRMVEAADLIEHTGLIDLNINESNDKIDTFGDHLDNALRYRHHLVNASADIASDIATYTKIIYS